MFWRTGVWSASYVLEADGSPVDEASSLWPVSCWIANECIGSRDMDLSDISIHSSTAAAIAWQWDDATRSLTEPDPKYNNITLTTRFDSTCSFFELMIPIKLKDTKLKDDKARDTTISALSLRICPSAVVSLSSASTTTAPEAVRKKFTSHTTRLDFRLNRNLDVLVPANAEEPIVPGRAHSGAVFDAIRQLSNTTSLAVYIQDGKLPKAQLQRIIDALGQGLYRSVSSGRQDLASLYGGRGAKIIQLSAQTGQRPPSYHEIASPPPSAPVYQKKRPRQDTQDDRNSEITKIWDAIARIKDQGARTEALENENRRLRKDMEELKERLALTLDLDARTEALENENRRLRKDVEELKKQVAVVEKLKDDNELVEAQAQDTAVDLADLDVEVADLRQDISEIKAKVDSVERGELAETVKSDVLEYIRIRLWGND